MKRAPLDNLAQNQRITSPTHRLNVERSSSDLRHLLAIDVDSFGCKRSGRVARVRYNDVMPLVNSWAVRMSRHGDCRTTATIIEVRSRREVVVTIIVPASTPAWIVPHREKCRLTHCGWPRCPRKHWIFSSICVRHKACRPSPVLDGPVRRAVEAN